MRPWPGAMRQPLQRGQPPTLHLASVRTIETPRADPKQSGPSASYEKALLTAHEAAAFEDAGDRRRPDPDQVDRIAVDDDRIGQFARFEAAGGCGEVQRPG